MKKMSLAVLAVVMLLAGCASKPEQSKQDIPDWYLNPPTASDVYYGVGVAKQSTLSMSKTVAETNARADIARNIKSEIKSVVDLYTQEGGTADKTELVQFAEVATRQVTDETLYGTVVEKRYQAGDGSLYVLMKYSKNALAEHMMKQAETQEAFERLSEAQQAELLKDERMGAMFDSAFGDK